MLSTDQTSIGLKSVPHIEWEKENNERVRFVDLKEEKLMQKIMLERNQKDYLDYYFVPYGYEGLRKTEAKLKKSDVQTDVVSKTQYVIVQESKNNEKRSVPLCKRASEIVSRLIEHKERRLYFPVEYLDSTTTNGLTYVS